MGTIETAGDCASPEQQREAQRQKPTAATGAETHSGRYGSGEEPEAATMTDQKVSWDEV